MNKVKLMRNIYCYIDRCFKDAYKMENRKYDKTTYSIDFILFKSKEDEMYELCPVLKCLYKRVYARVDYRLNHNLEKNFGVKYNDPINHAVHIRYNQIDPSYTQEFFKLYNAEDDTFIAFDIYIYIYMMVKKCMRIVFLIQTGMRHWYVLTGILPVRHGKAYQEIMGESIYQLIYFIIRNLSRSYTKRHLMKTLDVDTTSCAQRD